MATAPSRCRRPLRKMAWTGSCRPSSSARAMPCSRRCRAPRARPMCSCSTAMCRSYVRRRLSASLKPRAMAWRSLQPKCRTRAVVAAVQVEDHWEVAGVNSKQELAALERLVQAREARRLLEAGVTLADPARIDVRGMLDCGRDVAIDVNCVFEGRVVLADGVCVGPNCVLRNVTIGDASEVHAFSHLENAEIGARCRVGPFARLRPGAALADDVHVGNFVEVKASRLGEGARANHLSYIGDSEVGRRVNIGAGTITCNYDGVAKNRTVIEDDCFIGSDATLVAPVRIARGSYIGARSTITGDTPPGQLTLARARQVSVPSWKPPKKKA